MMLPAHVVAAGVLVWDAEGRLLMVKTHNREALILPGGLVEDGESPDVAGRREVLEEVGLDVRNRDTVYTSDHVLDLVIDPDRTLVRKDEDELAIAVEQGVFDAATAAAIQAVADEVEALVAAWRSPFCDGWERFRPSADWPLPQLPGDNGPQSTTMTSG